MRPSLLQRALGTTFAVVLALPVVAQNAAPATPQHPAPTDAQAAYDRAVAQQNQPQQSQPGAFTLTVNANIVLTNVVVRDRKTGELIKDLKAGDFQIFENGKPQRIASFDYQNVDEAAVLNEKTVSGKASIADLLEHNFAATPAQLKDHRLIVMFFDLSSMQDEDTDRAVQAAQNYVNKQMQPADLVALVSLGTSLSLDQDFTADKAALLHALGNYNGTNGDANAFAAGTTGTSEGTSDDASSFVTDDTEYNNLNTDRELYAIRQIAQSLARVDQRKSMLYFSGGLTRNGIENQATLRSATNEAAKANLAIYSVDARGLEALPPVGDASKGSLRGTAAYTGSAVQSAFNSNFSSQETLSTLSADTGGKAFFDSNDFSPAFQQVQHDTEAYYILGFHSTDARRNGDYRHLTVKVNRAGVKLEYRPGYYAPADFKHQKTEDRELALEQQMRSNLPATDVAVYLQALYFRAAETRRGDELFIPVSLIVPGSQIPFTKVKDEDKASIDILGEVRDAQGIAVGNIRDTVKLAVDASQHVERKNIQYSTGFTLAPGRYHLKFVVRENQTGAMGTFETEIIAPDLKQLPLRLSSVVVASQRTAMRTSKDKSSTNPLDRNGEQWIPNVAHVVRQDQHLYFLYEVYDPAKLKDQPAPKPSPGLTRRDSGTIHVLTSIEFLSAGVKVYETPLVSAALVNDPVRKAVAFQFDVPAAQLKPGTYICQVNVIDEVAGSFSFPRLALRILPAPAASTPAPPAQAAPASPAAGTTFSLIPFNFS